MAKTAAKTISYKRVQNSDFGHDDNRENRVQRRRAISTKKKLTQTMSMTKSGSILAVPSSTVLLRDDKTMFLVSFFFKTSI